METPTKSRKKSSRYSIASHNSFMSIGSIGSAFSIGSIGSFGSVLTIEIEKAYFAEIGYGLATAGNGNTQEQNRGKFT